MPSAIKIIVLSIDMGVRGTVFRVGRDDIGRRALSEVVEVMVDVGSTGQAKIRGRYQLVSVRWLKRARAAIRSYFAAACA